MKFLETDPHALLDRVFLLDPVEAEAAGYVPGEDVERLRQFQPGRLQRLALGAAEASYDPLEGRVVEVLTGQSPP